MRYVQTRRLLTAFFPSINVFKILPLHGLTIKILIIMVFSSRLNGKLSLVCPRNSHFERVPTTCSTTFFENSKKITVNLHRQHHTTDSVCFYRTQWRYLKFYSKFSSNKWFKTFTLEILEEVLLLFCGFKMH